MDLTLEYQCSVYRYLLDSNVIWRPRFICSVHVWIRASENTDQAPENVSKVCLTFLHAWYTPTVELNVRISVQVYRYLLDSNAVWRPRFICSVHVRTRVKQASEVTEQVPENITNVCLAFIHAWYTPTVDLNFRISTQVYLFVLGFCCYLTATVYILCKRSWPASSKRLKSLTRYLRT